MKVKNICILGGAGFIGRHVVRELDLAGYPIKVLTRRRENARHLLPLPNVQVVECDILNDTALHDATKGCDAVINLVGILHPSRRTTFEAIHGDLPRRLAAICKDTGTRRLIQISALHASSAAPSIYLRSKAIGEAAIKASKLNWTIFRPSVVFGEGDNFLNLFAKIARLTPIIPIAAPGARFQPIWVEDLAHAIASSVNNPQTWQQCYEMCGPSIYTMKQLVKLAAKAVGAKPCVVGLNSHLSYLQALLMEHLPMQLMSRDNLRSTTIDSVSTSPFPAIFGITLTAVEAIAPRYLTNNTPRANYLRYRQTAGR